MITNEKDSQTLTSDIQNHHDLPIEIQDLIESEIIPQNNIEDPLNASLFMVLRDYPTQTSPSAQIIDHTYWSIREKLINTLNAFGCGELHEYDNTTFGFDDCYLAPWSSSCPHQTERVGTNVDEWTCLERRSVRDITKGLELFTKITGQNEAQQQLSKITKEMDKFYDDVAQPLDIKGSQLGTGEYENMKEKTISFEGRHCSACELDSCIKNKQMTTIKNKTQKLTIKAIRIVEQLGGLKELTEDEMFEQANKNFEVYRKKNEKTRNYSSQKWRKSAISRRLNTINTRISEKIRSYTKLFRL